MLAAHPGVFSLPETHFFPSIRPTNDRLKTWGLTNKHLAGKQKLLDLGATPSEIPNWLSSHSIRRLTESFVNLLDRKASVQGKHAWVEKTPSHLHFVPLIERLVPDVHFIHIIRSGRDTIASLYEATNKYPESWGGVRSLETCLHRWINDLGISFRYKGKPNHFILRYEDLVSDAADQLKIISDFLSLEYSTEMLTEYTHFFGIIKEDGAEWTEGAGQNLYNNSGKKYNDMFNQVEKELVSSEIMSSGVSEYF
jgi:hypothetical protein